MRNQAEPEKIEMAEAEPLPNGGSASDFYITTDSLPAISIIFDVFIKRFQSYMRNQAEPEKIKMAEAEPPPNGEMLRLFF